MKSVSLGILILNLLSTVAYGRLLYVPLDQHISNSNLIVVGTLVDLVEKEVDSTTYGTGKIVIDKVVAGQVMTDDRQVVALGDEFGFDYVENFACVMGSHRRIEGEKGIFLLKIGGDNKIRYAKFESLNRLDEINLLINKGVRPKRTDRTVEKFRISTQLKPLDVRVPSDDKLSLSEGELTRYPEQAALVMLFSVFLFGALYRKRLKSRFERLWQI